MKTEKLSYAVNLHEKIRSLRESKERFMHKMVEIDSMAIPRYGVGADEMAVHLDKARKAFTESIDAQIDALQKEFDEL